MRILIAFVCMGFVGMVASALAFVQVLARTWPLLVIVVAVIVAVRWHDRRRAIAPPRALPALITEKPRQPIQGGQPVAPRPAAWVLVPVWTDPPYRQPPRHPVIDGEVITGDGRHG